MLPLQQAYEVREAVLAYIKATFRFKGPQLRAAFNSFISDKRDGLFKGPYINMKTPFVSSDENVELPLDIVPPFNPHLHQLKSFQRLTTKDGHEPKPTLLTTGTGSGKTECFLYPILDYIYQLSKEEKKPGVKVIIMYPMNALATDQATRLAEAISDDPRLKDKITAGLFLGMGTNIDSKGKVYPKKMGPSNIIEDRKSIVDSVPDILLTNFKMLDYALMKQDFMPIWKGNIDEENPALKFIVLDELHTYDGAQGTDMANLLRRLKLKLKIPKGKLIPVGTSATIGSGPDSKEDLCSYASDIFGEEILPDAIIEEDRVDVKDFFNLDVDSSDARSQYQNQLPSIEDLKQFDGIHYNSSESYVKGACQLWFKDDFIKPKELGDKLKESRFLYEILAITSKRIISIEDLILSVSEQLKKESFDYSLEDVKLMVETLIALVSNARTSISDDILIPFLTVQVQMWQRELSGIRRYVSSSPKFTWLDSIIDEECVALPMYFCRECGESGWITMKNETEDAYSVSDKGILKSFVHSDKDIRFMTIDDKSDKYPSQDYLSKDSFVETNTIDTSNLEITNNDFRNADLLDIKAVNKVVTKKDRAPRLDCSCPSCASSNNELAIVGGRTSTLSSVAVSQVMSSDFNTESKNGTQRKLLVFSNSVQDAAHLAGFYEMRTYRFLFRQSIHHYLNYLKQSSSTPVSLQGLLIGFKKYWKQLGEDYYYRFIPDDLVLKIDLSKNYRDSKGNFSKHFQEEFDHRVDWEICSEFGLMSQRGRTLEKMGSSATFFSEEDLSKVYNELESWLKNNNLGHLTNKEHFLHFLNGMLHRLRKHGGIDHVYLDALRENDFTEYNYNWYKHLSKKHFLNRKGGRASRAHLFVHEQVGKDAKQYTDNVCSNGSQRNWFYRYFIKSVIEPSNTLITPNPDAIDDMMVKILDLFVEAEILNKKTTNPKKYNKGIDNYAINPEKLYVEPAVQHIKCDTCEEIMYVAKSDNLTKGMQCLSYFCDTGVYNNEIDVEDNYYKRIYNRKNSPRIYAHEHTGLLDRKEREKIESIFKKGVDLDGNNVLEAYNVLAATSTLEMGIDIGDLNVVSNVSIPPTPSNFLQRVGRAGRKEGSALVLNYAKKSSHDQYYFAEPMLIMDGQINTPGCFLEAKDILKRHFYAYCIDSWITSNSANRVPARIKDLCLTLPSYDPNKLFVNVIMDYILKNKKDLISNFRQYYPKRVQSVISKLEEMLDKKSFFETIENAFWKLKNDLISLNDEINDCRTNIDNTPENDTEKKISLKEHLKSLYWKLKSMNKELVLEFMTNAGLLPNYAFPETGVKLYANVFSSIAPEDSIDNIPEPISVELVRPASQGIKDLAPGNSFYSQKMNLRITGLDVNEDNGNLKKGKYCSHCDAIAAEDSPDYKLDTCPKCGSESWGNNIHEYLLFSGATSSMRRSDAMMTDRKDEREHVYYHTMKHFRFQYLASNDDSTVENLEKDESSVVSDEESTVVYSYMVDNSKFGIEFCENVLLTEVNYGNKEISNEPVQINENDKISERGFVTCKHCGKVAISTNDASSVSFKGPSKSNASKYHYPYCNYKDVEYGISDRTDHEHFHSLYLYRTINTEAIKILLPFTNDGDDTMALIELVKAGLELGMKHYYKGSPEHLVIETYKEKNYNTGDFDNYLVIYDTIPGGTGYLAKLFNPSEFSRLLKISYDRIKNCDCQNHGKDGCYQCILTYNNQWHRENLSRRRAEKVFEDLLKAIDIPENVLYNKEDVEDEQAHSPQGAYIKKKLKKVLPKLKHSLPGNWKKISKKIGSIIVTPRLEDSQLEMNFVNMMKKIAKQNKWTWKKVIDKKTNTYAYTLVIKENRNAATLNFDNEVVYKVIPQYSEVKLSDAFPRTVPDFQFECTYAKIDGEEVDISSLIHWSVFLDGYAYHASKDNFRFYGDLLKREGIRKSLTGGKSRTWTLFWDDVQKYLKDDTNFDDYLSVSPNEELLSEFPNTLYKSRNSVERFLYLLSNPTKVESECLNYIISCFTEITDDTEEGIYYVPQSKIDEVLDKNLKSVDGDFEEELYIRTIFLSLVKDSFIDGSSLWYLLNTNNSYSGVKYCLKVDDSLEELDKGVWEDFWNRYNLIQMFESENTDLIKMLKSKYEEKLT